MPTQTVAVSIAMTAMIIATARKIKEERWLAVTTRIVSKANGSTLSV